MDFLQSYKAEIDQEIKDFFDRYPRENFSDSAQKLFEGCQYAVMLGGKRIRPILGLMVFDEIAKVDLRKSSNVNRKQVMGCLISLEFIHAYSLVHDDLPAMDNDILRRGQETVWKKYGEAEAILIGDVLCTMAFENLAKVSPDFCIKKLINNLSSNAGINGMGGGQMQDIDSEKKAIDLEYLQHMHAQKTGALLVASAQFGATLAQVATEDYEKISQYAEKLGLAFQIKDDLLDAEGDEKTVGKKIGKDIGSKGFVALLGLRETKKRLEQLGMEAVKIAHELNSKPLEDLVRFVRHRDW